MIFTILSSRSQPLSFFLYRNLRDIMRVNVAKIIADFIWCETENFMIDPEGIYQERQDVSAAGN